MIILLFGPPGCGKGTQAVHIARRFGIPAVSTGELFRAAAKAGTGLGKMAASIMASGQLVPDDVTNGIVAERISAPDCAGGFLLDGYPRTLPQAETFASILASKGLAEPIVIHLDVPAEALVARLTARRQCPVCKTIYNVHSQPPKVEGKCDVDGAGLITRADDREAAIRERLRAYEALTEPILGWYGASRVYRIDGNMAPGAVRGAIDETILKTAGAAVKA